MNRRCAQLTVVLLAIAGCRSKPSSRAADGMAGMAGMAGMTGGADTVGERERVHLTPAQLQAIGVTYTTVQRGPLERTVRTVGEVVSPTSHLEAVTARIDGFVEKMFVDQTGLSIRRGDPLLTIYSPMLVSAQEELLTARRLAASVDSGEGDAWRNAQTLLQAARRRLAYWDISADQIDRLEHTGEVTKTLTLVAPFDGVVLEKMVVTGEAVMPGMKLYQLADLSSVWIEGDVFEQDLALIHVGAQTRVEVAAYPGQSFTGRVSFVWPIVDQQSRTGRVRVVLPNAGGELRPGMFATIYSDASLGAQVLSVPADAVVMTGERNLVFVVGPDGSLEPRSVTLGALAHNRLQVLAGVTAGERIVSSANFLVDAESRLGSSQGMAGMPGMEPAPRAKP